MVGSDFWKEYWQNNEIIFRENLQSKVGRTINGVPISEELWDKSTSYIAEILRCEKTNYLLDVCAGSGVFSNFFADKVQSIDAFDISETLLSNVKAKNVHTIVGDLNEVVFDKGKFDRVLFYFAIQHFSISQLPSIFKNIFQSCKSGAVVLIGDIPDVERKFDFFDSAERKLAYFDSLMNNTPIIGEWFYKQDLIEMARFVGFKSVQCIEQPDFLINSHYRFDLVLEV